MVHLVVEGKSVEGKRDGGMRGRHSRKEFNYVNSITMDEGVMAKKKPNKIKEWSILRKIFWA